MYLVNLFSLFSVIQLTFAANKQPNIVVILADDLGWNDVSFHGSNQIPTPNIDKLARDGITLNNYYVQPICTPTRAALLTGRHPIHTGMQHSVIVGSQTYGLPLTEKLLPQYLKELGYTNHMVGKWHLGFFKKEYLPTYRGFDHHFGYWLGCQDYFDHVSGAMNTQYGHDFHRDLKPADNYTNMYSTELYATEAVNIIHNHNQSQPLFMYLPHQAVHSGNGQGEPLAAPQAVIDKFKHIKNVKRRIFAGMVSELDTAVGRVVEALQATQMMDNTIIVFSTDNGGPSNGFDFNAASNWPLRGVKATYWEGGVRGVGFIHSPLIPHSRYISNNMIQVIDWLPTLVRAAGGDPSKSTNLDGIDMWDMFMKNGPAVRTEMLHNIDPYFKNNAAIRVGDYKIVMGKDGYAAWDGWYPAWQNSDDSAKISASDVVNFLDPSHTDEDITDDDVERNFVEMARYITDLRSDLKSHIPVNTHTQKLDHNLRFTQNSDAENEISGSFINTDYPIQENEEIHNLRFPHTVKCGPKPANASSNCNRVESPCLFHIPSDPCEYNNIADRYPSVVDSLLIRIQFYMKGMVKPGNKPLDPAGFPSKHNGYWVPWL